MVASSIVPRRLSTPTRASGSALWVAKWLSLASVVLLAMGGRTIAKLAWACTGRKGLTIGLLEATVAPMSERMLGRGRRPGADTDPSLRPILITGICGRLGRRLARRLHRERPRDRHRSARVRRQAQGHRAPPDRHPPQEDAGHLPRRSGIARGRAPRRHARPARRARRSTTRWNVAGFQKLLEYVAQYDVPKLVVLSSANVYGPRPDNPQFLTEDAPLLGGAALQRDPRPHRGRHARAELLLEAPRDRDGDPAAVPHPRRACATRRRNYLRLNVDPDAARLRSDGAGHPRGRRGRARSRARSARACAASSTSRARRRCRSRA